MPTAQDYALAAIRLDSLSEELRGVIVPTERQMIPAQLTGGLLAAQVDELVARRSHDAGSFSDGIERMSQECRDRERMAAELDAAWDAYDRAYEQYLDDIDTWEADRDSYVGDPFTAPHPGSPPEALTAPGPIPDWYERS